MNVTKTTKIYVDNVGQQNARAFWQQFDNMQEKIDNLQSKIDKAIEYCDYSFKNPWYVSEKELLGRIIDILKEDK